MSLINKILVPVDFSPPSRVALRDALALADRFGASVQVVHVWEVPKLVRPDLMVWMESSGDAVSLAEHLRAEAKRELDAMVGDLDLPGPRIVVGDAATKIAELVDAEGFDLVVMGTHGRTGLSRFFLGSVAENVVRRVPCPVMTVHADEEAEKAA